MPSDVMKMNTKEYSQFIGDVTEEPEQKADRARRRLPARPMTFPGGGGVAAPLADGSGVKVHHGAHGAIYEIKAGTKLSDAMPSGEKADVPLDRWLAAAMLGEHCEDKDALKFAQEAKGMSGGTAGTLIPAAYQGEWIDNLRSFMVLEAAGMTTATMNARTVTSSRIVADPPASWRAEDGGVPAGDPTLELRNLVSKSLAVRVQATAELAQDSPDFGSQLLTVMGRALAVEIDRAGLVGTGNNNQPTGIANTAGIQTVGNVGTPTNFVPLVNGIQKLLEKNVALDQADKNAIMSARTWAQFANLTDVNGQPLNRPRALDNMAFRPTQSIPDNLGPAPLNKSLAIMGDFRDLVLGVRMEASIEALRLQSFAENLRLEFIGWTRVDFMVRRPDSFVVLSGIAPE